LDGGCLGGWVGHFGGCFVLFFVSKQVKEGGMIKK
jgi:hypothetical protein